MQIYHKAYVYLTCGTQLLVFDEPDFPEFKLMVPGGTVDPGESYLAAARREFEEETGLSVNGAFDLFAEQDLPFDELKKSRDYVTTEFQPVKGRHLRKLYHARVPAIPEQEWERMEMSPSNGGPPIRFRLFWIDLFGEHAMDKNNFHAHFGDPLDQLRERMRGLV